MQLCFICPIQYIRSFGAKGDFTLALSHLIDLKKQNEYEKAIKEIDLPILLDNGLFENHSPEPVDSLIKKAIRINAFAFFSPDYLYDSKKTKAQIDETYNSMKEKKIIRQIKMGAIVQADNKKDWIKQYKDFTNDKRISIIGLSILSIPKCFGGSITESRIKCINTISKLKIKHKQNHLLGLGEAYEDLKLAKRIAPFIKSNDSSSCFMTGLNEIKYNNDLTIPGGKIKEKVDFNLKSITPRQMECIYVNIKKVKKLL